MSHCSLKTLDLLQAHTVWLVKDLRFITDNRQFHFSFKILTMCLKHKVICHTLHPEIRDSPTKAVEMKWSTLIYQFFSLFLTYQPNRFPAQLKFTQTPRNTSFTGHSTRKQKYLQPCGQSRSGQAFPSARHAKQQHGRCTYSKFTFNCGSNWVTFSKSSIKLLSEKTICNKHLRLDWLSDSGNLGIVQSLFIQEQMWILECSLVIFTQVI